MRAGPMRYNIEFYSKTNTRDDYSGYEETYSYSFTTKTDVKHLGGSQDIVNDQLYPSSDIQFTLRYRSNINETMRIKFRDEIYGIDNISIIEPKKGIIIRGTKMLEM